MRLWTKNFGILAALAALALQSSIATAGETAKVPSNYKRSVLCMAGCGSEAPVTVYHHYPPLAFHPEPLPASGPHYEEIRRGIWCSEKSGCVAPDVEPPRYWVRDYGSPSVAMVFWFR